MTGSPPAAPAQVGRPGHPAAVRTADRWRAAGVVACVAWVACAVVVVGWYVGVVTNDDPLSDVHGYITVFGPFVLVLPALGLLAWALLTVRLLVRRRDLAWVFHWTVGGVGLVGSALVVALPVVLLSAATLLVAWAGSRSWRRAAGPPA
ncbi:hypothetical protein KMZ32_00850 [Phycicoccus sp. MAQZ13P-2]|uniref:hypothetical protein n=1 Tax=Phycicoccus mangrovi TaxID=2840470 RepID=UPI001C0057A1|nr:hypothetical protein [Phycicoccus mangrovi]MBT9254239.1 hypothetical protein [Phycicoccus mangrovi]MBT9272617.1 hypothetical protein [Phycicoccus mangrovi]